MFTGLKAQLDFTDDYILSIITENHPLVKLKKFIPWKEVNAIYKRRFKNPRRGNASKSTDVILGLIILKQIYDMTYRELVKELHHNLAFMYFCSVSLDELKAQRAKGKAYLDHSTLVKNLHRLGARGIAQIEKLIRKTLKQQGFIKGKNLFVDTTSLEKNIIYPTEVNLLKRVIEHAEIVIQRVKYKKDLVKSEVIRQANRIAKVYYSAGKKTQELLMQVSRQLAEIARAQVKKMEETVKKQGERISRKSRKIYEQVSKVGVQILAQTEQKLAGQPVVDKIVSFYESHVRALPKGKVHKPCEFGVKLRIDMTGNGYISNYQVYQGNPADCGMLKDAVRAHAAEYGEEFEGGAMDRGFADTQLVQELEQDHGITLAVPGKKDRKRLPGGKQQLYDARAAIEAKISEGKRMTGLGLCRYKGWMGDRICGALGVMALNLRKMLRETANGTTVLANL